MNRIKKFENFQLNEISTNLADRAKEKADGLSIDPVKDPIQYKRKNTQANKFGEYLNPEFVTKLKSMGFASVKKDNKRVILELEWPTDDDHDYVYIYIYKDSYSLSKNVDDIPNNLIGKINRAIKLTQNELSEFDLNPN